MDSPQLRRFKAVEINLGSRQPTGTVQELAAPTRHDAVLVLLEALGVQESDARIAAGGSIVQVGDRAWSIIARETSAASSSEPGHLRRGGPTHRHVR